MPQFTRVEAERQLAKVRPLLEDLQRRVAAYRRRPTDPVAREIEALLREIAELGAEVKDPEQGLTGYRVPHEIEFRDSLPETLVGKVLRRILADEERAKRQAAGTPTS